MSWESITFVVLFSRSDKSEGQGSLFDVSSLERLLRENFCHKKDLCLHQLVIRGSHPFYHWETLMNRSETPIIWVEIEHKTRLPFLLFPSIPLFSQLISNIVSLFLSQFSGTSMKRRHEEPWETRNSPSILSSTAFCCTSLSLPLFMLEKMSFQIVKCNKSPSMTLEKHETSSYHVSISEWKCLLPVSLPFVDDDVHVSPLLSSMCQGVKVTSNL